MPGIIVKFLGGRYRARDNGERQPRFRDVPTTYAPSFLGYVRGVIKQGLAIASNGEMGQMANRMLADFDANPQEWIETRTRLDGPTVIVTLPSAAD
jgi:hypothetical protein